MVLEAGWALQALWKVGPGGLALRTGKVPEASTWAVWEVGSTLLGVV